jgi:hypothetical protein
MDNLVPPQMAQARAQLEALLEQVEKKKVDLVTAPWAEIEKSAVKLLLGPFRLDRPEHHVVALGVAAAWGERLMKEHGAFWFPNRDAPEGASIGFPEALIMLSPYGGVVEALLASKLERLQEVTQEIRTSLAKVKFSPAAAASGPMRLGPADYQRLFDPGFVQLVAMDAAKAATGWNLTGPRIASELREGLVRIGSRLPAEVKQQLEAQLLGALTRLDPSKPLIDQVERAPRVAELVAQLWGTKESTGAAPEEFWEDVVFPTLFIGAPAAFPKLEGEELELLKRQVDPYFLFLEVVPHQYPAPEEALLGAFPGNALDVLAPQLSKVGSPRLVKVTTDSIKAAVAAFDPAKTQEAVARFCAQAHEQAGTKGPAAPQGDAAQMFEAAVVLLTDLKKTMAAGGDLCVRRLTEGEAGGEAPMVALRAALQGPRIILA